MRNQDIMTCSPLDFFKAGRHSRKVSWIWKSLLWMLLFQCCCHFVWMNLLIVGFRSIYGILNLTIWLPSPLCILLFLVFSKAVSISSGDASDSFFLLLATPLKLFNIAWGWGKHLRLWNFSIFRFSVCFLVSTSTSRSPFRRVFIFFEFDLLGIFQLEKVTVDLILYLLVIQ